jgi:hypothetical protein
MIYRPGTETALTELVFVSNDVDRVSGGRHGTDLAAHGFSSMVMTAALGLRPPGIRRRRI